MATVTDIGSDVPPVSGGRIARGYWVGVGRRLLRDPVAVAAAVVILAIVLSAVFAPWIAPADPYRVSMLRRLRPIGDALYPVGSDELGRDMLSRLIYGGRLSLLIGLLPVAFAFCVGSMIGIFAGFVGGRVNTLIMRTVDVFFAFPSVLLAVALSGGSARASSTPSSRSPSCSRRR
jgi:peptide/nickel transport system permease protein